jgi:hypothetical protein
VSLSPEHHFFAFSAPRVNRDVVSVTLTTGAAAAVAVRASRSAWRQLIASVGPLVAAPVEQPSEPAKPLPRVGLSHAQRRLRYRELWARFIASRDESLRAFATRHGIDSHLLGRHFAAFRKEPGAPALRPNGKL